MGGTKKKSMAQMEKEQESRDSEQAGQAQKAKKGKEQKSAPAQQKKLSFLMPKMTDEEMVKSITPLKAITVVNASRALGVNASIATGILRGLEGKKLITRVGGFSGHYVWAVA